ncbi:SPEF2 isoform 15, partial [Pongo abelii]
IQNELYLSQEDFFINGNIKVFPDPPPPIRLPPVEKEEDGTLTIEQLDSLRDQFLDMAPKECSENCFQRPSPSTCDAFSNRRQEVASWITGSPPELSQGISCNCSATALSRQRQK